MQIMKDGCIKPRQDGIGNWVLAPSVEGHVYLTRLYAGYFGLAIMDEDRDDERIAILEIDTDLLHPTALYPDEDYIEQALRNSKPADVTGWMKPIVKLMNDADDMGSRTAIVRRNIEKFRTTWHVSLDRLGNMSHKGQIPLHAVTRISFWNPRDNTNVWFALSDPTITVANAQICGEKYEELTKWLMGDKLDIDRYTAWSGGMGSLGFMSKEECEEMFNQGRPEVLDFRPKHKVVA